MSDTKPKKGQVRDAIVDQLLEQPHNTTELAKKLGVTKPTVSYHIKKLLDRGIVEVADVEELDGGFVSKYYRLSGGGVVNLVDEEEEERIRSKITHLLERKKLQWDGGSELPLGREVQLLLFHVFRLARRLHRTRLDKILGEVGREIGASALAGLIQRGSPKDVLEEVATTFQKEEFGYGMVFRDQKTRDLVFDVIEVFDERDNDPLLKAFLSGLLQGVTSENLHQKHRVVDYEREESIGYGFLVTRRRNLG